MKINKNTRSTIVNGGRNDNIAKVQGLREEMGYLKDLRDEDTKLTFKIIINFMTLGYCFVFPMLYIPKWIRRKQDIKKYIAEIELRNGEI